MISLQPVTKKSRVTGNTLRRQLSNLDKSALLALLQDLYDLSVDNRDFIHARCQSGGNRGEIVEKYRKKIVEQFFPARGEAKLKLDEARKAIKDYRKATKDGRGTAELLMTYVEQGAEFTADYGDIDERFYYSLESALNELAGLLLNEAPDVYQELSERLARVEQITQNVGWGFHDHIADVVWNLKAELDEAD